VSLPISGYRYVSITSGGFFGEGGYHIRIALVLALASRWQRDLLAFHLDVHGWVDQCEEVVSWPYPGKAWLFAIFYASKEGFHRLM